MLLRSCRPWAAVLGVSPVSSVVPDYNGCDQESSCNANSVAEAKIEAASVMQTSCGRSTDQSHCSLLPAYKSYCCVFSCLSLHAAASHVRSPSLSMCASKAAPSLQTLIGQQRLAHLTDGLALGLLELGQEILKGLIAVVLPVVLQARAL